MAVNTSSLKVEKVGLLGVGSMGQMMPFLMAERGYEVHFLDPSEKIIETLRSQGKDFNLDKRVCRQRSYEDLCKAIESPNHPKFLVLSTPPGTQADEFVEALRPHLKKCDVIIDCGDKHWSNTERRQKDLEANCVHYVVCGVSCGYQSALNGPSMSPSGSPEALDKVMPFLKTLAAKDEKGRPCVAPVGPRWSGHYVKMVHDDIEQGMMSVVAEGWLMLTHGLGLKHEDIIEVYKSWNDSGPLRNCFFVPISLYNERVKEDGGEDVVALTLDKAVQDVDEEQGAGTWTCAEAVALHVPAATILTAHLFRSASTDLARRTKDNGLAGGGGTGPQPLFGMSKQNFVQHLRFATYFCFLTCFVQGLHLIRQKDKQEGWKLDYTQILQTWRGGGCVIQADHITDLLEGMYERADHDADHLLANAEVGWELSGNYLAIKKVVSKAVESDMSIPAISQSMEYYKYETSREHPTQLLEVQMDLFGQNMFHENKNPVRETVKGQHHGVKLAKGLSDE